jgi:hypothetical protein
LNAVLLAAVSYVDVSMSISDFASWQRGKLNNPKKVKKAQLVLLALFCKCPENQWSG